MSAGVKITRVRMLPLVECENCDRLSPEATRERCRVHVQQTGHTVRYSTEDVTRYDPEGES